MTDEHEEYDNTKFTTIALSREMRDWLNSFRKQVRKSKGIKTESADDVLRRLKKIYEENFPDSL